MGAVIDKTAVADMVIENMVAGLSMRQSCLQAGMTAQSFLRVVEASPQIAERYAHARNALLDAMVDKILELADSPVPLNEQGSTDPGLVRQRQLQVDARKWILSKLAPSKYGDRLDVSVTDTRISISGALAAANARLVDVIDVTPVITHHSDASDASDDAK